REHCIVDIAFLPEHRGRGMGTALMQDLLDEAELAGKPVTIHVEQFNPAMRLYRRLGFEKVEGHGVYDLMRWTPADGTSPRLRGEVGLSTRARNPGEGDSPRTELLESPPHPDPYPDPLPASGEREPPRKRGEGASPQAGRGSAP